jgi:hypothetical protein
MASPVAVAYLRQSFLFMSALSQARGFWRSFAGCSHPLPSFKAFYFCVERGRQLHPAGAAQLTKQYRYPWELQSKRDRAIGAIATGTGAASPPKVAMWFRHRRSAEAG